ncbi:MAG: protein translocase subunit SecD, partial [Luteolibacter sp.]
MLVLASLFEDPMVVFLIGLSLLILFFWYFASEVERRKRNIGSVLLVGLTALCLVAITPPKERLKGGIDIVGGASFSLQIQPKDGAGGQPMPITKEQVDQAKIVIEKRLRSIGYPEALIYQQGEDGLMLQIPGVEPEEAEEIREILTKVAKLELHKVSERTNEPATGGKSLAQSVLDGDEIVVGQRSFKHVFNDADGNEREEAILLYRRSALGGKDIANAVPSPQQADAVAITLNAAGTDKMIALTSSDNMRAGIDRIAIVLDGEVVSAPVVNQTPLGKRFIIEGLDEPGEVETLANQLMNPLENPLEVGEMRLISPTLGKAVVTQGLMAGAFALTLTYLFMLLYYRVSGFIAAISLTVCGVLLFGFMAMFGFTFSLPGIAGMVLTVGMAVDANVLIYERMREEFAFGKDTRIAIGSAYDKAFSAIFDSNITTLITACILFMLGSGAIKSFAITLIIGLSASMFAAILGTRAVYRWGMDLGFVKKLSFMNLIKATKFDFMGKRKAYAVIGLGLILISIVGMATKKDTMMGIDFTGGTTITYQLGDADNIPVEDIEKALSELELSKKAYPQEESNPSSGLQLTVRCATEDASAINDKLRQSFESLGAKEADNYLVDASIEQV